MKPNKKRKEEMKDKWITKQEAAHIMGCSEQNIDKLRKKGILESKRIMENGPSRVWIRYLSIPAFMRRNEK